MVQQKAVPQGTQLLPLRWRRVGGLRHSLKSKSCTALWQNIVRVTNYVWVTNYRMRHELCMRGVTNCVRHTSALSTPRGRFENIVKSKSCIVVAPSMVWVTNYVYVRGVTNCVSRSGGCGVSCANSSAASAFECIRVTNYVYVRGVTNCVSRSGGCSVSCANSSAASAFECIWGTNYVLWYMRGVTNFVWHNSWCSVWCAK